MDLIGKYETRTFPPSRLATIDIATVGLSKHHVTALIEVDVTDARKKISELRELNSKISFNAWLIKCISETAVKFDLIHGIKKGKRKVVVFEDVDIAILIEREVKGQKVPLPYVIRKTNTKSIDQIYCEIEQGKNQSIQDPGDNVLGEKKNALLMKFYYMLPGLIRRSLIKYMVRNPYLSKKQMGTIVVTSLGMAGNINGWVIPITIHPLCFGVGSIVKKPGVIGDKIAIRDYLPLTIMVDHDVVDGVPAAEALSELTRMIESGYGLDSEKYTLV